MVRLAELMMILELHRQGVSVTAIARRTGRDGYVGRIIAFCEGLSTFPLRGAPRDDLLPGLRVLGFERRTTIAFMVTPNAVLIEGIFYGSRDTQPPAACRGAPRG